MLVNYSLKTPIEFSGKTYTDLTFREPKTGDMMVLDKFTGEMSKMVALIATIADVPIQVIKDASLSGACSTPRHRLALSTSATD